MTQKTEAPPDVVETATYKALSSKNKQIVALKAPSYCFNRSSDQRTGTATSQELVLGTNCAVDMVDIERALTKASYRVISWTVLEREMAGSTQQEISPLKVAENLGAQILFQINSMEKSTKSLGNLGKEVKWEFDYFDADDAGNILGEKTFDSKTQQYLKQKFFNENELLHKLSPQVQIPFVTLDASAIQVKNGESIWFYRWTHSDLSRAFSHSQLIYCDSKMDCKDDTPSADKTGTNSSKESEVYSSDEKPEYRLKASYAKLVKKVIDDLVSSFSK